MCSRISPVTWTRTRTKTTPLPKLGHQLFLPSRSRSRSRQRNPGGESAFGLRQALSLSMRPVYSSFQIQTTPAPASSTLVPTRRPPARSPTPPTRVVKSTYGGNLFTADDVIYLKKYIDYCHDQGLVLRFSPLLTG